MFYGAGLTFDTSLNVGGGDFGISFGGGVGFGFGFLREVALRHPGHHRCRYLDHNLPAPCWHDVVVERRMDSHRRPAPWGSRMSHLPHPEQGIPSKEMPVSSLAASAKEPQCWIVQRSC